MTEAVVKTESPMELLSPEKANEFFLKGDFSKIPSNVRGQFLAWVAERWELDPIAQPFKLISTTQGTQLYATKACTEQLVKKHRLNVELVEVGPLTIGKTIDETILVAKARVTWPPTSDEPARFCEDVGAVFIGALKGEDRANAVMKTVTKAKRRTTLSACGLGMLDEMEVATIPGAIDVTGEVLRHTPIDVEEADQPIEAVKAEPKLKAPIPQGKL